MEKTSVIDNILGADQLVGWFGPWPDFHDAEVLEAHLRREGSSWIKLHTWRTTDQIDKDASLLRDKHAIVTFRLKDVTDIDLAGFNRQNVIFGLELQSTDDGFKLSLLPCFGFSGTITAGEISVDYEPKACNE